MQVTGLELQGYRLLERIGKGGFGEVFRAVQLGLDREVAIKVLNVRQDVPAEHLERFRRETRILVRLAHPGLVTVYDAGVQGGLSYLAMEYVRGSTLAHLIEERAPVSFEVGILVLRAMASALAYLHREGVVHRDLNPSNVLMPFSGGVKIVDFGLARSQSDTAMTGPLQILGTRCYLAPEVAARRGGEAPADLYAVGLIAYQMLTGDLPYYGTSTREWLQKIQTTIPAALSGVRARIPGPFSDLVSRLLEKEPTRRPTADELEGEINRWMSSLGLDSGSIPHRMLEGIDPSAGAPPAPSSGPEGPSPVPGAGARSGPGRRGRPRDRDGEVDPPPPRDPDRDRGSGRDRDGGRDREPGHDRERLARPPAPPGRAGSDMAGRSRTTRAWSLAHRILLALFLAAVILAGGFGWFGSRTGPGHPTTEPVLPPPVQLPPARVPSP